MLVYSSSGIIAQNTDDDELTRVAQECGTAMMTTDWGALYDLLSAQDKEALGVSREQFIAYMPFAQPSVVVMQDPAVTVVSISDVSAGGVKEVVFTVRGLRVSPSGAVDDEPTILPGKMKLAREDDRWVWYWGPKVCDYMRRQLTRSYLKPYDQARLAGDWEKLASCFTNDYLEGQFAEGPYEDKLKETCQAQEVKWGEFLGMGGSSRHVRHEDNRLIQPTKFTSKQLADHRIYPPTFDVYLLWSQEESLWLIDDMKRTAISGRDNREELTELLQSKGIAQTPDYETVPATGSSGLQLFEGKVRLGEILLARGLALTREAAEQCAARQAVALQYPRNFVHSYCGLWKNSSLEEMAEYHMSSLTGEPCPADAFLKAIQMAAAEGLKLESFGVGVVAQDENDAEVRVKVSLSQESPPLLTSGAKIFKLRYLQSVWRIVDIQPAPGGTE